MILKLVLYVFSVYTKDGCSRRMKYVLECMFSQRKLTAKMHETYNGHSSKTYGQTEQNFFPKIALFSNHWLNTMLIWLVLIFKQLNHFRVVYQVRKNGLFKRWVLYKQPTFLWVDGEAFHQFLVSNDKKKYLHLRLMGDPLHSVTLSNGKQPQSQFVLEVIFQCDSCNGL